MRSSLGQCGDLAKLSSTLWCCWTRRTHPAGWDQVVVGTTLQEELLGRGKRECALWSYWRLWLSSGSESGGSQWGQVFSA